MDNDLTVQPAMPASGWLGAQLRRLLARPVGTPDLQWRWWRWVARLDTGHMVFIAPDREAWARLEAERALIAALRANLECAVPEIVASCDVARIQVRMMIHGCSGRDVERVVFGCTPLPTSLKRYPRDCPITPAGKQLARDLGRAIAQIQSALDPPAARALGLRERRSDATFSAIRSLLERKRLGDLVPALDQLEVWHGCLRDAPALCHGDLHMHNLAIDRDTGRLLGVFDFDAACIDHPLSDLRYVHSNGTPFAVLTAESYQAAGGARAPLQTIERFHLLGAFRHFIYVDSAAERFPHIVEWARAARDALGAGAE